MKNKQSKTLKYYDENALDWGEHHHELSSTSKREAEINEFCKLLGGGKILEIGSGTGTDAQYFKRYGFDYIGTDASVGLLDIAKKRNPSFRFENIAVEDLSEKFKKDSFDGFWAAAVLLHIAKSKIRNTLKGIHFVVKNGGIGFISLKQGEGESEDDTGRLFVFYSQDEFSNLLEESGFEIIKEHLKPTEGKTVWLEYFVKVIK